MIIAGHRGAKGYAPENTIAAFKKGISLNADYIEFDVRQCKTGELVIIHDDKVDRTSNGRGKVSAKTFAELRKLDFGEGQKIPTLQEALDFIKRRTKVNVEVKEKAEPVLRVIDEYVKNKGWNYDDFIVSSFEFDQMIKARELNKQIRLGLIFYKFYDKAKEAAEKIKAFSLDSKLNAVDEELVNYAHSKGIKVFAWVVNSKKEMRKMKKLGVDGVFSNKPDLVRL